MQGESFTVCYDDFYQEMLQAVTRILFPTAYKGDKHTVQGEHKIDP